MQWALVALYMCSIVALGWACCTPDQWEGTQSEFAGYAEETQNGLIMEFNNVSYDFKSKRSAVFLRYMNGDIKAKIKLVVRYDGNEIQKIDIALIQETHLEFNAPPSKYTIPRYSLVNKQTEPSTICQHRPTVITTGIIIPRIAGTPKPRWNFRKADSEAYKIDIDKTCQRIKPVPDNAKRFTQLILSTAKKHIARGFNERYIPCWSERSQELLDEYGMAQDHGTAEELHVLKSLLQSRREEEQKLLKTRTLRTLVDMPGTRQFHMILKGEKSKTRKIKNGMPQGSVIAPTLFNIYISDMPEIKSLQLGYADDWVLTHQSKKKKKDTLSKDTTALKEYYFDTWYLKMKRTKPMPTAFHLSN
ncbi:RNA-directed DNA polymerase from mobile element jockey [Elysia marginata]|uniref:RNA-directed DNA polymerase from mobile element jockey n=1 Tax=Elysia marginata TaxID=1093978 RepID=A0AAV4ELM0_9GAST|nr:RNA-directed DNA polymerase from mobile element jockey [Elysia marginata]